MRARDSQSPVQAKGGKGQGKGARPANAALRASERREEAVEPKRVRPKGNGSFLGGRGAGARPPEKSLSSENSKGVPPPLERTATADGLGRLVGVSGRMIRELAARDVVVRAGRGRYDVAASVPRYCESLRQTAAGRGGDEAASSLAAERTRLAREQADAMAAKNAALRREFVPAVEVERAWVEILRDVRAGMLAVATRVGARVPTLTAHDVREIDREIRDALAGLADA